MKRQLSPSDHISTNISKKQLTSEMPNTTGDVFSWDVMKQCLDEKLTDVAKKEDLKEIKEELAELRIENQNLRSDNQGLRKEVSRLTSRVEAIDRKTRTGNVVVNGLKSKTPQEAKDEFQKICSEVLLIQIAVNNAVMLKKECFMFSLDSSTMVQQVLAASKLLKGRPIYIQKDYTSQEQKTRYNLRQIAKSIRDKNKLVKIRHGDQCIFVNDVRLTWYNEKICTKSTADLNTIKKLFNDCNLTYELTVNTNLSTNSVLHTPQTQ